MKKAFTLVELLIVIVIIGILASLAMGQYQKLKQQAAGAEAMQNIGALVQSISRYYIETGRYPAGYAYSGQGEAVTRDVYYGHRIYLNDIGLDIKFQDERTDPPPGNRKWDYGCTDHTGLNHGTDTDYTVWAMPHSISSIDTADPNERNLFWHCHMKNGQPAGKIINCDPWPNGWSAGEITHTWAEHQK